MFDPAIESELDELEAFVRESDRLAGRDPDETPREDPAT